MQKGIVGLREWNDQFRWDTMNAINLLMMQGKIDSETNYEFRPVKGKMKVVLWLDFGEGPISSSVAVVDPVDLIVAAGHLDLVRGKRDSM